MGLPWRGPLLVAACLLQSAAPLAQDAAPGQTPILVLDWDRLFSIPRVEARVLDGIAEERTKLVAENTRIENELTAEERELTKRRSMLKAAEFQKLADAFDRKVQQIRADRDARERELQLRAQMEWQSFRQQIETSLIIEIMQERGAVLVMDRNQAIMFSTTIDITEEAIARLVGLLDASSGQVDHSNAVPDSPHAVE